MSGYWLLKTEPTEYSFGDLEKDGTAPWDGVRNALAQKHIRTMALGDVCVIYHSGGERQAIGLARVATDPYPDIDDPSGKLTLVDLAVDERLKRPVSLGQLKSLPEFADSPLLRMSRLSVVPLTEDQFAALSSLAAAE
jgi:predicted RNA-binding protein with PUA-like domain